jgi:MYXO-CTERM domain-containing protein
MVLGFRVLLLMLGWASVVHAADWPRLPTDAELNDAATVAAGQVTGRLLYTSGPIPFHDPAAFARGISAVESSGALLAMAWQAGGETISVNGQDVGTSATKVYGSALRLFWVDGDFVFAPTRPRQPGEFIPALEMSEAAALAYSLRSEAAVRAHVDRHFTPRPDGYGYVRGFPVDATPDVPIEVVIGGGVAAVVVAGAVLIRRRRRTPANDDTSDDDDDDDDDDDVVGHVLQLGVDRLALAPGASGVVPVSVWRVKQGGAVEPEPDATITVRTSEARLTVSPTSSKGASASLSLTADAALQGTVEVTVTAHVSTKAGAVTRDATITVDVATAFAMVFS